jgi:hypothetical protein
MTRYFLELVEDGHRMPIGEACGYGTRQEAEIRAKRSTDDALPRNFIRVFALVSTAHLGVNGKPYLSKEDE